MPSEYDALLEAPPTQQKSEYDQLLAQQPTAPSGAGEILKTAGKALLSTLGGFIPKSPLQAAEMATPLVGGVETLISTPKKLADVAFGGKSVAEAFPESQTLVEAEKTPAFSKERFEAGFGILGQIGMAAGLAKGLKLRDVALGKPESEIPLTSAAEEVTKNAQKPYSETGAVPTEQVQPVVSETAVQAQARDTRQTPPQTPQETVVPSTEAAAVSGAEMPPAAAPQIPEGAKVNVKLRTPTGEMREARGMDAKEAEGIFTKEKSSYQALLDCLGA